MSFIDDVADYMEAQGVGTVGTDLFKSYMPDSGDGTYMAVYDTGGPQPDPYIPTKEPTFQVLVRSNTYSAGRTKLDAIRAALHQEANFTQGDTYFYFVLAISEGGHIGRNERGLDEFSINFQCRTR